MSGRSLPLNYILLLALCILALMLAVTWPAPATAQPPDSPDGSSPGAPDSGPDSGPPTTPGPTAAPPTPTRRPDSGPGDLPGDPTLATATPVPTLTHTELIKALAPNRIIFHAATPIQLSKVEEGLQVYFVGRDGKTRLGPWVPGFAELAAKYPDPAGPEASIYLGFNPLTGKRVKIDYLPSVKRIRVDTFYADRENDVNKQYIFHFGPEHDITYDVW